jgi:4'-phosphopantetheinyl transferase
MASQGNRPRPVHVWFVPVGALNIRFVRRMKWLLSDWEQQRLDRLRVEADKVRFIAAHLLVRVALSKTYPATLTDWKLDQTVAGKPFVCGPCGAEGFQFSLAHTSGLVGCAVTSAPVGFDIEPLNQDFDVDELLSRTLATQELARWGQTPCDHRVRRFLSYWTLKEALAKGLGVGMHAPFSSLAFELEGDSHARVLTLPKSLGDASSWKVRRLDFMGTYVGAVAVSSEPGETIELCIHRMEAGAFVSALPGDLLSPSVRDLPERLSRERRSVQTVTMSP